MGKVKTGNGPHDRVKKGRPGAGSTSVTEVNVNPANLADTREIEDKYLESDDELAESVHERHPNRNTNKPSIDKPPYA